MNSKDRWTHWFYRDEKARVRGPRSFRAPESSVLDLDANPFAATKTDVLLKEGSWMRVC